MIRIVVAVASAAMSHTPPFGQLAVAANAARAKPGMAASTAAGAKLAATIRLCSRHRAPSELSRPLPIVGPSNFLTMSGFT